MGWVRFASSARLLLVACFSVPAAAHAEWAVTGAVGETVEANDNVQVESDSPGGAVGSITTLSLQAINEWPTLTWTIGTSLGFSKYWGSGANDSLDGLHGGVLTTTLDKAAPLTDYHAAFSATVLPASVSEVLDSGVTNANTTTFTYSGQGSLTHQVNALNAIGLSASARSQSFSNDGSPNTITNDVLTANTYLTAGQSWIHNVNPRTNLTLAASTGWYLADGVGSTDSVSESVTLSVQKALSERLNFTAGGGGNVVWTTGATNETNSGFIANLALAYELATTTFSAFASHNLAPSSLGQIQESTQAGFSVAHQINDWSGWNLSGAFVFQLPVASLVVDSNRDQQHQALVLSAGYNRVLAENWNLGLRYTFTQQNNSDDGFIWDLNQGSSTSNAVFATITRNFNLLP